MVPKGLASALVALRAELPGRWFTEIDAPYYEPMTLLRDAEAIPRRYVTIPPEAFPVLSTGVDGCHIALWFDEARADEVPSVVYVSPMDSNESDTALGRVLPVASDVTEFVNWDLRGGWRLAAREILGRDLLADANLARQKQLRRRRAPIPTLDGMGVVLPTGTQPAIWEPSGASEVRCREVLEEAVAKEDFERALVIGRDTITLGFAAAPWFGELMAHAYTGLGRPFLARQIAHAYDEANQGR
jgi:hypothetical protein